MTARVSIVIASYNYGRFLAEAIGSALAQTHPDTEVIVSDDGSTDDSLAVAQRFPGVIVVTQPNQGVSTARNNGATFATGDYLLFLDADDALFPEAVARLLARLQSAPAGTGYAYGQMQYFDSRETVFASREFDPAALARNNYVCATTLIRREAFDRVGGFDRGMNLREDWEFYVRLWHAGYPGVFLPEPVLRYRKHKPPTRKQSKVPKRLAMARLEWLYPRFFWLSILKHPLRHLWYRWRYRPGNGIRRYGPSDQLPRRPGSTTP